MKVASLVVLAYERPEFLKVNLESLLTTPSGYPMEIIVHNDGSTDPAVLDYLAQVAKDKRISMLINNCGKNQGIEKAVKRSIACSSGEYIFKLDTDLLYTENWLKKAIKVLETDPLIGAVGLVDYRKYDPKDERFWDVEEAEEYLLVQDFVSSAYGFRKEVYDHHGWQMSHDGWHLFLRGKGYKLAIKDVVTNFGFGRSIYVGPDGQAVNMNNPSLTF
jgi:glycosyltransferase involved in cell wall biosynthesis